MPREVRFLSDAKTLISVSEAEMRVAVLADITVVQGEPSQFQMDLPEGYEVTGVTGATLDSTETNSGVLTLKVNAPGQRSHQFLISMERSISGEKADAPFLSFKKAQRETGEVLVEGAGTMELTATEGGGLKRMDVKEANPVFALSGAFPAAGGVPLSQAGQRNAHAGAANGCGSPTAACSQPWPKAQSSRPWSRRKASRSPK